MTRRYPIVRHRELRPLLRWSTLRHRRHPLVASANETLVHRIGEEYVTGPVDPARAAAVTVVDVRRDVIVGTGHVLPAAGSPLDYRVTVFFRCTVVDPVAVVRARHTEAVRDLEGFLTRDTSRVERLARMHPPGDERGLHRALDALLEPWPTYARTVPGVQVDLAGVDVLPATILGDA
jgi:hypothetical protein